MNKLWFMIAGAALVSGCVYSEETRPSGAGVAVPAEAQVACAE